MRGILLLIGLGIICGVGLAAQPERPLVGAIRWDAWTEWGWWQQFLAPKKWHSRLPFFAKVTGPDSIEMREDTQEVIDEEILMAAGAGLDYWAFDWYHPESNAGRNHMGDCLELYRKSKYRDKLNYCLILLGGGNGYTGGNHLTPLDKWPETVDWLVNCFTEPNYQKVLGNRPLVYFFSMENLGPYFGGDVKFRRALHYLRRKTQEAGLGEPYYAAMTFWPATGVEYLDKYRMDAISAYVNPGGADGKEQPYSLLAGLNRWYWNEVAKTGRAFIPTVNAGWDYRPLINEYNPDRNKDADWFVLPTREELRDHLQAAVDFVEANPTVCEARAIIIYAWNECAEGGWLLPTEDEGTLKLDAIRDVLRPEASQSALGD